VPNHHGIVDHQSQNWHWPPYTDKNLRARY
jgi:hypothetical protein